MTTDLSQIKTEGWVSLRQFLQIANITYPTGRRWVKWKMIKSVRRGHTICIMASEIKRFLEEGTLPPDESIAGPDREREKKYRDKMLGIKTGEDNDEPTQP